MTVATVRPVEATRERSWVRRAGPLVLILGSACTAPVATVAHLTATGDRLLGLAALAVVAVLGVRGRLRWTSVHTALAIFVGSQALTTAANAMVWPQGPKFVTVYLLGFSCFALAAEWARGAGGLRRMTRSWIAVGAVVAVVGTVTAALSNMYQQQFWGAGPAQMLFAPTGHLRVLFAAKATFDEWNLFSSFLLIPFTLVLWTWRPNAGGQRLLIAALAALVFGLVHGVTRAAWLSMAGIIAFWWRLRRPPGRHLAALGLIAGLAFLLQSAALRGAADPPAALVVTSPLSSRVVEPIKTGYDWNMVGRIAISRATIASWWERPVLGRGAGSINRLSVLLPNGSRIEKVWNGNVVLFVLHDSGLPGLAALLGFIVLVYRRATRAIRREADGVTPSLTVPLLTCGAALCVAYQFTHGLWLMYPYVYLGFLTAATEAGSDGV